jgi:hypothetical protein
MHLPHVAPPPYAPCVVQGSGGPCAHIHMGAMAVVLQAALAALPGGRAGGWGAGGPLTALDEVLPWAGHMDDRCVANLVHGWCDLATATAIMADLGQVAADAAAVLMGGGKGGGGTKSGGGGGGIEGRIIVLVIVDIGVVAKLLTLTLTSTATAAELKAAELRTAVSGARWQCDCSCRGKRVACYLSKRVGLTSIVGLGRPLNHN